jgi:hypothetical protein
MREKRNAYRILAGKPEGKRHLGRQDVGEPTILKLILERPYVMVWTGLI